MTRLRLAFYGDDFTGSTDALEVLSFAGVRCALFLQPPTPEMLSRFDGLEAIGVAGDSRAMTPDEMDAALPAIFDGLAALAPPILHYKVCSTFDSGPAIGSIGRVMEIARRRFPYAWMPIVAGTPNLGRWCLFGHLFARSGTDGRVYRIDRHPIMSVHPVTPMDESDLARHVGRQGALKVGVLPFDRYDAGQPAVEEHLRTLAADGVDAVVLDAVTSAHMTQVGELLEREAQHAKLLFIVGSSGVEYALTQHWRAHEAARSLPDFDSFRPAKAVLAVSGSASRLSALQVDAAVEAGFVAIPVDAAALVDEDSRTDAAHRLVAAATEALQRGHSVILHTARGPDDPRIAAMLQLLQSRGHTAPSARHEGGRSLGKQLGYIVRDIMDAVPVQRLLLSGGDMSSQITKVLDPDALVISARLAPGAPLCRLVAPGRKLDGMEVALKGGQMSGVDFFERARAGTQRK